MIHFDWVQFLSQWSDEVVKLLEKGKDNYYLDDRPLIREVLDQKTLMCPPASQTAVLDAERRIGIDLPPTYKEFLRVSNGWRQIAMDTDDGYVLPVEQIGASFREVNPEGHAFYSKPENALFALDEEYYVYGKAQDPGVLRTEYLSKAIAFSQYAGNVVYLFNPMVRFDDGEIEAWVFGELAICAVNRYKSFADLMVAERIRTLRNLK